jgi:hypothetical protein
MHQSIIACGIIAPTSTPKGFGRSRERGDDERKFKYNRFLIKYITNLLLVFFAPDVNNINIKFFLIYIKPHLEMGDYICKNFYYY